LLGCRKRETGGGALVVRITLLSTIILAILGLWMLKALKRHQFSPSKLIFHLANAIILAASIIWTLRRLRWPHFSAPWRLVLSARRTAARRIFIFVSGGNTSRSPMAQAICSSQLARFLGISVRSLEMRGIHILSAGLSPRRGTAMVAEARQALAAIGIRFSGHRARLLRPDLVRQAEAIFCMTRLHRETAIAAFPADARKIHCLDPNRDVQDPSGQGSAAFIELARVLQTSIQQRVREYLVAQTS
jgi:protein-tyrosine-phosphatase